MVTPQSNHLFNIQGHIERVLNEERSLEGLLYGKGQLEAKIEESSAALTEKRQMLKAAVEDWMVELPTELTPNPQNALGRARRDVPRS